MSRRDRQRAACPTCGRDVTVRSNGVLMAHRTEAGAACQPAAWQVRQAEQRRPAGGAL